MKLTLDTLYRDHDNLRSILCLLERLLIDIVRGSSNSYQLLQLILVYIQDYPARIHHPAEYAVFSAIAINGGKHGKFHEDIRTLMQDHEEIEATTRDAIASVEPLLVGTQPDIANAGVTISTLIDRERSHLLFEEMHIYPYIAAHLRNEDWEKISALVPDHEDPVFGKQVRKKYEPLFRALQPGL